MNNFSDAKILLTDIPISALFIVAIKFEWNFLHEYLEKLKLPKTVFFSHWIV